MHLKGPGLFNNLPSSQAPTPRLQAQLGPGVAGLPRHANGLGGFGSEQRSSLTGPPGLNMGPSANLNLGTTGDYVQLAQLKQRQFLHEFQNQQLLRQQAKANQFGQQQQAGQAQLALERREQHLRQLMQQQHHADVTPQQIHQLQVSSAFG